MKARVKSPHKGVKSRTSRHVELSSWTPSLVEKLLRNKDLMHYSPFYFGEAIEDQINISTVYKKT